MAADPDLIALFARGWALTRQLPPPVPQYGGHFIPVGQPDQVARYIFASLEPAVIARLGETIREPAIYLKICEEPDRVRGILPAPWVLRHPPTYMMTRKLERGTADPGSGYTMKIEEHGSIIRAAIYADGVSVAAGQIGLMDDAVLFDQIATNEAHRRRGLGTLIMTSLATTALEHGATSGLLCATAIGRALYESIGWAVHAPYTSAVIPSL